MQLQVAEVSLDATGNVSEHIPYDNATKTRGPGQGKDAHGTPLWEIEVLRKDTAFGRPVTLTERVTAPSQTAPTFTQYEPIGHRFVGLVVDVFVGKSGLGIRWTAASISSPAAPKRGE